MKRYLLLGLVVVSLILSGIAGSVQAQGRGEPGRGQWARLESGGWEFLGERAVQFWNDRDRLYIGRNMGSFTEIQVRVNGAPVEINDMVVTFSNGDIYTPALRRYFDGGAASVPIDLPGGRRFVEHIDFNYRSLSRRDGQAIVMVYAR
jgi:hypothetical protein